MSYEEIMIKRNEDRYEQFMQKFYALNAAIVAIEPVIKTVDDAAKRGVMLGTIDFCRGECERFDAEFEEKQNADTNT